MKNKFPVWKWKNIYICSCWFMGEHQRAVNVRQAVGEAAELLSRHHPPGSPARVLLALQRRAVPAPPTLLLRLDPQPSGAHSAPVGGCGRVAGYTHTEQPSLCASPGNKPFQSKRRNCFRPRHFGRARGCRVFLGYIIFAPWKEIYFLFCLTSQALI